MILEIEEFANKKKKIRKETEKKQSDNIFIILLDKAINKILCLKEIKISNTIIRVMLQNMSNTSNRKNELEEELSEYCIQYS
jgi:hypothetical protein